MSTPPSDEMAAFRASATALLHRLQNGLSTPPVELVYVPHTRWPVPKAPPTRRPLQVLPTAGSNYHCGGKKHAYDDNIDYDAKLLLLSVRNADKALKPGDATYPQRLEMMNILARDIVQKSGRSDPEEASNVAIAIIDEPTFVGKSSCLQALFKGRFAETPEYGTHDTQLNFILGFDTLERLIQPRYYGSREQMMKSLQKFLSPSPEGDDSRVICARRGSPSSPEGMAESADLAIVEDFITSGRIVMIDIGKDLRTYSSTEVRNTIRRLGIEASEWRKFVPPGIADYIVHERLYVDET
ncbi:hypothetical protein FPV67DRAFT_1747369 [Lyophyllum atratum]|nr:hypothetical protein FPV67DRAFT_1747369 [Lyophyllum atratum]